MNFFRVSHNLWLYMKNTFGEKNTQIQFDINFLCVYKFFFGFQNQNSQLYARKAMIVKLSLYLESVKILGQIGMS